MHRKTRDSGQFISLRTAEAEFGLPYARLYQLVTTGSLPCLDRNISQRAIWIRRTDLEELLANNMTTVRS